MDYKCSQTDRVMTVAFFGDIDEFACRTLRSDIDAKIVGSAPKEVIFDLNGVSFVDSTGIGFILGRYKKLCVAGGRLKIAKEPPPGGKVFRNSGGYFVGEKGRRQRKNI